MEAMESRAFDRHIFPSLSLQYAGEYGTCIEENKHIWWPMAGFGGFHWAAYILLSPPLVLEKGDEN